MRNWFAGVFLSLMALGTHAANPEGQADASLVNDLRARLIQTAVLRGAFEQNKQVAGFKKPLQSRGDFLVVRERGVIWHTQTPFAGTLKLTRDEIVARQNGAIAFRLSASKEPGLRVINGLLFALLNGDIGSLTEAFAVSGSVESKGWQLTLTPKSTALAKIMLRIELAGDQFVQRVQIHEANGDRTDIRFSAQKAGPDKLTEEEAAQFD